MLPWKPTRRYAPIILCFGLLLLLYSLLSVSINWEYNATFDYDCRENGSEQMIHYCIKGPSVFFVETSGSTVLNARQACAVESGSRHNSKMSVTVLMTGNAVDVSHPLMSSLTKLPNVRFQAIDVDVFVHGSPIWSWYRTGKWKKSKWKVSHLSDALRFLVMWKYGGMYLDLDTVTLRSMEHLRNAVITENWDRVAAGILIFERENELMARCVVDFSLHYDKNNFAFNGPGIIARNIRELCGVQDVGKVSGSGCGVNILPPEAAFPISFDMWEKYFEPSDVSNISNHFNSSYMIHVWNKYSFAGRIKIGTNSLYETAIKENCPSVYKYAQKMQYI